MKVATMPKSKPVSPFLAGDLNATVPADERTWARSHGTYIAGRAWLDEADATAAAMEVKWGVDRLRLLVGLELREKFDRQRYLLNQAIWHGELEDVRRESGRAVKAWLALDAAATEAGATPLDPLVWEVAVGTGDDVHVVAIVPDNAHAHRGHCARPQGRCLHARRNRSPARRHADGGQGQDAVARRQRHRVTQIDRRSARRDRRHRYAAGRRHRTLTSYGAAGR